MTLVGACPLPHSTASPNTNFQLPRDLKSNPTRQATEHCYGNHLIAGCRVAIALVCWLYTALRYQVDKQRMLGAKKRYHTQNCSECFILTRGFCLIKEHNGYSSINLKCASVSSQNLQNLYLFYQTNTKIDCSINTFLFTTHCFYLFGYMQGLLANQG